jgi:hypothetical protein
LPIVEDYTPYFDSVSRGTITLYHNTFFVVSGKGFRYAVYRHRFLEKIDEDWYTCPNWLPRGKCYFKKMYFPPRLHKKDGESLGKSFE